MTEHACSLWLVGAVAIGLPLLMLSLVGVLVYEIRFSPTARLTRQVLEAELRDRLRRLESPDA